MRNVFVNVFKSDAVIWSAAIFPHPSFPINPPPLLTPPPLPSPHFHFSPLSQGGLLWVSGGGVSGRPPGGLLGVFWVSSGCLWEGDLTSLFLFTPSPRPPGVPLSPVGVLPRPPRVPRGRDWGVGSSVWYVLDVAGGVFALHAVFNVCGLSMFVSVVRVLFLCRSRSLQPLNNLLTPPSPPREGLNPLSVFKPSRPPFQGRGYTTFKSPC